MVQFSIETVITVLRNH